MNEAPDRVILIGNYAADGLESMLRFGTVLHRALGEAGVKVDFLAPELHWGSKLGRYRYSGVPKWLGYLDKYLVFPPRLKRHLAAVPSEERVVVHVVDHGNAMYVPRRKQHPWVVTCHDLLTVRAMLGEDTTIRTSLAGKALQRWILRGLARSDHVVCDSEFTRNDLYRLVPTLQRERASVVWISLNHPYRIIDRSEARRRLSAAGLQHLVEKNFVLHVGSNLPRKNRDGVLRIVARLATSKQLDVVFAGQAPNENLLGLAATLGMANRLHGVAKISNDTLEALYALAHALLFPSYFEGFGWPVAEAQACGCPVVCSNTSSIPEVAGEAALLHEVVDEVGMAESLEELFNLSSRASLIAQGRANVSRFTPAAMAASYLEIYRRLSSFPRKRQRIS